MVLIVFVVSMFLSSALLFLVEPMIAKMLLPMLGGTPSVWNTCLVFFQAVLLVGYLYAHASSRWLTRHTQIVVHLGIVLLPLVMVGVLPVHLPAGWEPPAESSPVIWVLATLVVSVGLPFFVLSSTAPILQRWFADSGHAEAADPYFLYAASNAGSLSGLLAYPLFVEPLFWLRTQVVFWSAGYVAFVLVIATSAAFVWGKQTVEPRLSFKDTPEPASRISTAQRVRWVALAFVPSSLVLGITTSLTTDVPAIPLFWVLPLIVYLISFIIVFAKRPPIRHAWMVNFEPLPIMALMFLIITHVQLPFAIMSGLSLFALFGVAMGCHGELAQGRPSSHSPDGVLSVDILWGRAGRDIQCTSGALNIQICYGGSARARPGCIIAHSAAYESRPVLGDLGKALRLAASSCLGDNNDQHHHDPESFRHNTGQLDVTCPRHRRLFLLLGSMVPDLRKPALAIRRRHRRASVCGFAL